MRTNLLVLVAILGEDFSFLRITFGNPSISCSMLFCFLVIKIDFLKNGDIF